MIASFVQVVAREVNEEGFQQRRATEHIQSVLDCRLQALFQSQVYEARGGEGIGGDGVSVSKQFAKRRQALQNFTLSGLSNSPILELHV